MNERFTVTREDGAFAVWDHERKFFAQHDGPRCMRKADAVKLAANLNAQTDMLDFADVTIDPDALAAQIARAKTA